MGKQLIMAIEKKGLKINYKTCNYISVNVDGDIKIDERLIEKVETFLHLEHLISIKGKLKK